LGNTLTISLLKHTINNICLDWVTVSLMLFIWFLFTLTYEYTLYKFTTVVSYGSKDVDTFWPPGLTPSFVREIWTLSDHLVQLPVLFERCGHILTTWSHTQFCSRDVDTSWSPGFTPSFVREIGIISDHLVSLPVSFERFGHFLIMTWSRSQFHL
jgi:hypothetical protein